MKLLLPLSEFPGYDRILKRAQWTRTDHYTMCCRSELWGCASLIMIAKKITEHPNQALLCILMRLAVDGEGWNYDQQKDITINQIVRFARGSGYIAADSGFELSLEEFHKNFLEILDGMNRSEEFKITRNGLPYNKGPVFAREEVLSVTCFTNEWNNRQYFCETPMSWFFFSWGTGA